MAKLQLAGATEHELATVSRLQPDRSVHVKALTGLGRVRTLLVESIRLQLAKARVWTWVRYLYGLDVMGDLLQVQQLVRLDTPRVWSLHSNVHPNWYR